jgi:hypothetical protein
MRKKLFSVIIIVILPVLILFGCQNNKEESSSNTLDYSKLKEIIHDYLQNNIISPHFGGKVFCSYELFGNEIQNDSIYIYLWTLCMGYYIENGNLKKGPGVSMPVALIALPSQQGYEIIEHKRPMAGEDYGESIREIFPRKYHKNIFPETKEYNRRANNLMKDTERQAKIYYKLK